jgi:hypothetical protein
LKRPEETKVIKKNKDKDKFKVAQEGYQIESQAAQIVKKAT